LLNTLYVGGTFTSIDGTNRNRLAVIDVIDGDVLPWNFSTDFIEFEEIIKLKANSDVVVVQDPSYGVLALDAVSSDFLFGVPSDIRDFEIVGDRLIVGGTFDFLTNSSFYGLASINIETGEETVWTPVLMPDAFGNFYVYAISKTREHLLFGGGFQSIDFSKRTAFGAYDITHSGCPELGPIGIHLITGESLMAPEGDSYQWFKNGVLLDDGDEQILPIDPSESGLYEVVIEASGCPNTWREFDHIVTATEYRPDTNRTIYPNPSNDIINLNLPADEIVSEVMITTTIG
jgi:hypothetical protein